MTSRKKYEGRRIPFETQRDTFNWKTVTGGRKGLDVKPTRWGVNSAQGKRRLVQKVQDSTILQAFGMKKQSIGYQLNREKAWILTFFFRKRSHPRSLVQKEVQDSRMVQVFRTKKQGNANWLKWENERYNLRLDYCIIQYSLHRVKEQKKNRRTQ